MKIWQAVLAVMEVERRVNVTRDKKRQSLVELRYSATFASEWHKDYERH
jgi:hypothetical protein